MGAARRVQAHRHRAGPGVVPRGPRGRRGQGVPSVGSREARGALPHVQAASPRPRRRADDRDGAVIPREPRRRVPGPVPAALSQVLG